MLVGVVILKIKKLGIISKGQDGAVFHGYLFRFNADGSCNVYRLADLSDASVPVCRFVLDKAELIVPHCNSVAFGNAYYSEHDEFPLLYCNVYNNYSKTENKRKGITCVYRLEKRGDTFVTTLVQLIEIGFTEDPIWRSENCSDVRPYGNCAIDTENGVYYAFTMRDEDRSTRYFAFDMPSFSDGVFDPAIGVKRVVLSKEEIRSFFDCEYHHYIQGACFHKGILYSVEGFTDSKEQPPALRLIDVKAQRQAQKHHFADHNMTIEPELIDFENGICYYADHTGNVFELIF